MLLLLEMLQILAVSFGVIGFGFNCLQVMHPKNPFAPTLHFNYRYFETDAPQGMIMKCVVTVLYSVHC